MTCLWIDSRLFEVAFNSSTVLNDICKAELSERGTLNAAFFFVSHTSSPLQTQHFHSNRRECSTGFQAPFSSIFFNLRISQIKQIVLFHYFYVFLVMLIFTPGYERCEKQGDAFKHWMVHTKWNINTYGIHDGAVFMVKTQTHNMCVGISETSSHVMPRHISSAIWWPDSSSLWGSHILKHNWIDLHSKSYGESFQDYYAVRLNYTFTDLTGLPSEHEHIRFV